MLTNYYPHREPIQFVTQKKKKKDVLCQVIYELPNKGKKFLVRSFLSYRFYKQINS